MKTALLRGCAALLACTAAVSANAAGILDNYTVEWTRAIATKEGSAVAYNWDQNRLMVTNDEEAKGSNGNYFATLGEYDMNGNFLATITVNGCQIIASNKCDPEGLTYIGNNNYVIGSERVQDMFKVTSATMDGDRTYTSFDTAQRISIGPDAGNKGLEGIAFDRKTGDFWGVKETDPQTIYKITGADWAAGAGTVTNPFSIGALGLNTLSDIAVLSNGGFSGATSDNLLILSGTSKLIMEVTKTGALVGSYSLAAFTSTIDPTNAGGKFEGMTLDGQGNIYLVSDDGNGPNQSYMVKLKYNGAVPEPTSWALMIAGFGLVGANMRRRKVAVRFA
ncbi:MAG: SdiA-regulated domain-containing protein [Sphingobium sp.]|nr:SdiA-regulated domain-containing protein [Sphingobium sp.]